MLHLLSITVLSIILLADGSAAASNCFIQQGDRYSKPSNRTDIVSRGLVCPQTQRNRTCTIEGEGYLKESSTLNITTTAKADIFSAVSKASNQEVGTSVVGTVEGATYTVLPGQSGYVGFVPDYYCYQGVLGSGCFKDVAGDTAVEACEPRSVTNEHEDLPSIVGTFVWVSADAHSANFTTNPAAERPSLAYRAGCSGGLLAFATVVALLFSM